MRGRVLGTFYNTDRLFNLFFFSGLNFRAVPARGLRKLV
jgi:hypothetical protein